MAFDDVGELFIQLLRSDGSESSRLFRDVLANEVEFSSAVSPVRIGPVDVVEQLEMFQKAGRFGRAIEWKSEVEPAGVRVVADLPVDSFYMRYVWDLAISPAGKVEKILQTGIQQTQPLTASPIQLNEEIAAALRIARDARNPVIVAYINSAGQPSQAPRGTVQVFSTTQLALWIHDPRGGLVTAIGSNPNVSLHYWGGIGTTFGGAMLFQGVAHIEKDETTRRTVYDNSPASEQRSDPDRKGCAVVVDLVEVSGFLAGTRYNMSSACS